MDNNMLLPLQQQLTAAYQEVLECNDHSSNFGLVLSETEITELVTCRSEALRASGRIEFGGGVLPKLIQAFCDSPYIDQENYANTLAELQETFYYFKTEAMDRFSDDELIDYMVKVFNGRAQGSTEYLSSTSLEALARYARTEFDTFDAEEAGDLF